MPRRGIHLGSKILKALDFTVGLDVAHQVFRNQDLFHVSVLCHWNNGIHDIVSGPEAAVKTIMGSTVHPLLPGAGDVDHVFPVFLAQGIHNGLLQLIAQLDGGIILLMPLHPGLGQQIITEKVLKPSVLHAGCTKELPEGTEQTALEAVLRSIRTALDIGLLHLLQTRFLIHREQREQVTVTHLTVRLRVAEVLGIIDGADILQEARSSIPQSKSLMFIVVSSCILDW